MVEGNEKLGKHYPSSLPRGRSVLRIYIFGIILFSPKPCNISGTVMKQGSVLEVALQSPESELPWSGLLIGRIR